VIINGQHEISGYPVILGAALPHASAGMGLKFPEGFIRCILMSFYQPFILAK
jgi:hypothetical protein